MRASRPTSARWGAAVPVWPETQNLFVGAGFIPPAEPCGGAWPRDDASIVPYRGLWCGKAVISRLAAVPAAGRRGGFHIRPGCSRRREARRDEGIPPYVRPAGSGRSGLARNTKFVRRGGIYPARKTLRRRMTPGTISGLKNRTCGLWPPKRACGRSASIVPQSASRPAGRCEHRPLQGLRRCGVPGSVGRAFTPAAPCAAAAPAGSALSVRVVDKNHGDTRLAEFGVEFAQENR